jgi:hypothetical protein
VNENMKINTLEMDHPCFLSVDSVQKFFKSSTKGVNEKVISKDKVSSQHEINLYSGGGFGSDVT